MRAVAIALLVSALAFLPPLVRSDDQINDTNSAMISLPAPGGWVLHPDGETLIVSSPLTAEIIFINTTEDKELKRFKVDFQPAALALRGPSLYVVGKGASLLYVLDAETGKPRKDIKVPGSKLTKLAVHPTSGPLFATNDAFEVLSINTEAGKVTKTIAQGNFLAVDPVKGEFLYTGTQKPMKDTLVLSRGPGRSVRVGVARSNRNSSLMKYSVKPKEIKPLAICRNAAINGNSLAISHDGKKIAMVGGGGLESEGGKRTYAIAVFDTDDLETQLGQIETGAYPADLSFHPVLDLGVAEKSGGTLILFNARSLAPIKTMIASGGAAGPSAEFKLLTFAGRGTKLVYYHTGKGPSRSTRGKAAASSSDKEGQLYLIPLELTDEDKGQLAKAFPAAKP